MSSKLNIVERNRANARHSTGPKTDAGKAKVSQNARRYGLFVSDTTLEYEEPEEFAEILADLVAEYAPRGLEVEMVRQLASATQRLRRYDRIENAHFYVSDKIPETRHEANILMHDQFKWSADFFLALQRARSTAERAFTRLYQTLEARKASRRVQPQVPPRLEVEIDSRHQPVAPILRPTNPYPATRPMAVAAVRSISQNKPSPTPEPAQSTDR